jgi:hypothetical protein
MRLESALAVPAGEDLRSATLRLSRAREGFMASRSVPSGVRPVVAASWRRCARADLSPDGRLPPVRLDTAGLAERRSGHPLAALLPVFRELLGGQCEDRDHIFAVMDQAGTLLWVEGDSATLRRAAGMNFVAGAGWSEADAGTNAPGTALAAMRPVQIIAAEHYNALVHRWSCAAAPVRDPASGQVLGVIDITGGESVASPYALGLVRVAARVAEAELARRGAPAGAGWCPLIVPGEDARLAPGAIRLAALGRDNVLAEVDGRTVQLRPRHSEIAVLLALAAGGLPGPRLAVRLSEEEIHPVTLRAEMSRLRTVLGGEPLGSHPYAFRRPVTLDFTAVLGLLGQGRVAEAVAAYRGPLLPYSEAPAIVEHRAALDRQLRAEVLASGDAALLRHWVSAGWGADDVEAWQALARALPGAAQRPAPRRNGAVSPASDVMAITKN